MYLIIWYVFRSIIFGFVALFLVNCSATTKLIKHGKLETQTKMSNTIFLDPLNEDQKTVFLQVRNTTDRQSFDIEAKIKTALVNKGYVLVNNPKKAYVMVQANILQVGKDISNDPFSSLTGGYGSGVAGFFVGSTVSGAFGGSDKASLGAGVAVGAIEYFSNAMVDVVVYSMITDLQISERTGKGVHARESGSAKLKQGTSGGRTSNWDQKTDWKRYQTRVISVAKKTNLKFEDAEPELTEGLAKSISGIL